MSLFLCADQSAKARVTTMRSLNNKLHCAQCRRSCCVEWQTPCWDVLKWQPHWEDAVTLRLPSPAAACAKRSMVSAIPRSSFMWQLQNLQRPRLWTKLLRGMADTMLGCAQVAAALGRRSNTASPKSGRRASKAQHGVGHSMQQLRVAAPKTPEAKV